MHVDLIDRLRCMNRHADSWLVAVSSRSDGRRILDGTLGCPECGAEYAITGGVTWFGREEVVPAPGPAPADADAECTRLAALLGLDERGGVYLLAGTWAALAAGLVQFGTAQLLLASAPGGYDEWSTIRGAGDALPLAEGSVRGVAIDRASPALGASAAKVLVASGRLVAPAVAPIPEGITVLARDERHWVGERTRHPAASELVTPRRAAPRTGNR
jgi:hypothetical protein